MDRLTQTAADWIARDEPRKDFYAGLYAARRKHGADQAQATREIADYMRFRLSQAAELAGGSARPLLEDLDRIDWTAIAREHSKTGEFLYLYRQMDGKSRYEVRRYMQELSDADRKAVIYDFKISDSGQ